MWRQCRFLFALCVAALSSVDSRAGGSALNVIVVANQASSNSLALANYYCEKRGVPEENVIRISWPGSAVEWTLNEFDAVLARPLRAALLSRQLSLQIDYVVLSMDIPYRVRSGDSANSTTSALFYGFKADTSGGYCSLPSTALNPLYAKENFSRALTNLGGPTNALLTMMITASNLVDAKFVVDQGVFSDGTFPQQPVVLGKSADLLRNIRHTMFDNSIFNSRLLGVRPVVRQNCYSPAELGYAAGYQNGHALYTTGNSRFAPGSLADDLTSFGGRLYELNDQTPFLAYLKAGAAASYGTVVEPCAHLEKFPSPMAFFYQARGFNNAEAYYQSVSHPHQGLMAGDPLAAPFAQTGRGGWENLEEGAVLVGAAALPIMFTAAPGKTLDRIDLFMDGKFLRTLTNVGPAMGNTLLVRVGGLETSHRVPANATLGTVTAGLAAELERQSSATGVKASAVGDRLELKSTVRGRKGAAVGLSASTTQGNANALTVFARAFGDWFAETPAAGVRSFTITNPPAVGDWLQFIAVLTNGSTVAVAVTNRAPGMSIAELTRSLLNAASAHPVLNQAEGLVIEDVNMHEDYPMNVYIYGTNDHSGTFAVRARASGWDEAQIKISVRGSSRLGITPSGTNSLEENLEDLQLRAHVYLQAGFSALKAIAVLDTTSLADGAHELTGVAYEGSHARTQAKSTRRVQIRNTGNSASLRVADGAENTLLTAPLTIAASAAGSAVAKIELFATGGLLHTASGMASVTFRIDTSALGAGLHSFYAIVTFVDGKSFRTDKIWVRLLNSDDPDPGFQVRARATPLRLEWPATAGRSYEVLAEDGAGSFLPVARLQATNSPAGWVLPDDTRNAPARLYRVRTAD